MSATLPGGRPVDIELLGEFSEGLLSAAEADAVRALVASDPVWASTLAELRDAAPVVEAALTSYAEETGGPMPADVGDRLAAALRSERDPAGSARSFTPGSGSARAPSGDRRTRRDPPTRPVSAGPPATSPPSEPSATRTPYRRRIGSRTLWTRGGLVAVLVLAVAGIGVLIKLGPGETPSSSKGSAGVAAAPAVPRVPERPDLTVTASGTNYTSLNYATPSTAPAPAAGQSNSPHSSIEGPAAAAPFVSGQVPTGLDRLLDPAALDVCLRAIETVAGGTAQRLDFATYQGGAAVIVTLASPPSVVAAGPNCGLDGAAHQLAISTPH